MWLIGGDDNFVSQFLVVLEVEKKNTKKRRKKMLSKTADEQGCEKSMRDGAKN